MCTLSYCNCHKRTKRIYDYRAAAKASQEQLLVCQVAHTRCLPSPKPNMPRSHAMQYASQGWLRAVATACPLAVAKIAEEQEGCELHRPALGYLLQKHLPHVPHAGPARKPLLGSFTSPTGTTDHSAHAQEHCGGVCLGPCGPPNAEASFASESPSSCRSAAMDQPLPLRHHQPAYGFTATATVATESEPWGLLEVY